MINFYKKGDVVVTSKGLLGTVVNDVAIVGAQVKFIDDTLNFDNDGNSVEWFIESYSTNNDGITLFKITSEILSFDESQTFEFVVDFVFVNTPTCDVILHVSNPKIYTYLHNSLIPYKETVLLSVTFDTEASEDIKRTILYPHKITLFSKDTKNNSELLQNVAYLLKIHTKCNKIHIKNINIC